MKADYVQRGESINYVNEAEAKITAGDIVVIGNRVGVAGCDIKPGGLGSLHVVGVYNIAKANPSIGFAVGADVYYTESGVTDDPGETPGNLKIGWAAEPSAVGVSDVLVKLA